MNIAPVCRSYITLHPWHSNCKGYVITEEQTERTTLHMQSAALPEQTQVRALLVSGFGEGAVLDLGLVTQTPAGIRLDWHSDSRLALRCWDAFVLAADWPQGQILALGMLRDPPGCTEQAVVQQVVRYLSLPQPGTAPAPQHEPPSPPVRSASVMALPRLVWPSALMQLKVYFDRLPPCAPFSAAGWRFVQVDAQAGLPFPWIILGRYVQNSQVLRVCWAVPGQPHLRPAGLAGYTWTPGHGKDGYWVLMQEA